MSARVPLNYFFPILMALFIQDASVADWHLRHNYKQLLRESEWVVAGHIIAVDSGITEPFPCKARILLRVEHLLKGRNLPELIERPGYLTIYQFHFSSLQAAAKRSVLGGPPSLVICFLRENSQTKRITFTSEEFGVEDVDRWSLLRMEEAGLNITPLVNESRRTFVRYLIAMELCVVIGWVIVLQANLWFIFNRCSRPRRKFRIRKTWPPPDPADIPEIIP